MSPSKIGHHRAVLLLITLASGFWLSRSGKPYSTGIMTLHKLLALAASIFAGISVFNGFKIAPAQTLTVRPDHFGRHEVYSHYSLPGAAMSIEKTNHSIWLILHRIAPFLLAGSVGRFVLGVFGKRFNP